MKAQAEVARKMKTEGFKRDLVGEEEVIAEVEQRLVERGVAEELIRKQSKRFRFYRMAYRENMRGAVEAAGMPDEEVLQTSPAGSEVDPFDFEEMEAAEETPLSVVGMGTFVMSIVGRSKRRTLHRVGGCYRIPGVDYRDYVVIGDTRPALIEGEKLCGTCFGSNEKAFSESEEVPSSESSSSELMTPDPDDDQEESDWWWYKRWGKKKEGFGVFGLICLIVGVFWLACFGGSCSWLGGGSVYMLHGQQSALRVVSPAWRRLEEWEGRRRMAALTNEEWIAKLTPDLQGLLDSRKVAKELQAGLAKNAIDNIPMLSAVAIDRAGLTTVAKDLLGLDVTLGRRDHQVCSALFGMAVSFEED